jgi:hypothetical protein
MWRNGFAGGLYAGFNVTPHLGLRLGTRFSDHAATGSDLDDVDFVSSTNMWAGSLELLYRLTSAGLFLPYITVGAGVRSINPGGDGFNCTTLSGKTEACVPLTTGGPIGTPNSRSWALREQIAPEFSVGLGADLRMSRAFSVRLQVSDRAFKPSIHRAEYISVTEWTLAEGGNAAKLVHQLELSVGLVRLMGIGERMIAATSSSTVKSAIPPEIAGHCPELSVWDPMLFQSAPLRKSVTGSVLLARESVQNILATRGYRYAQSQAGKLITNWSVPYPHPVHAGMQRRHALVFDFVQSTGGTDVVARWLVCSSDGASGDWRMLRSDELAQPEDIEGILGAIRR